jgi:hypothetical protein
VTVLELLKTIEKHARSYRIIANKSVHRNKHMNNVSKKDIKQKDIDALLVDFINYIASKYNVDYALYTHYLENKD